jgi:predicted Rossmann fold flavoprotein
VHVSPHFYQADSALITQTLQQFPYEKCRAYFEELGLLLTEEALGRIFPLTGKATAVTESLKVAVLEAGAELVTGAEVLRIKKGKNFSVSTQQTTYQSKRVVLACGSCAYPQVSGTQSGYNLAKSLGHRIISPRPVLSAVCLKETALARLSGIRQQVRLQVWKGDSSVCETEGELLFTNYGISGPAAINASGEISRLLTKGPAKLTVNLFPQTDFNAFFQDRLNRFGHRKPKDFFAGMLHESISNLLIDFLGIRKNIPMKEQFPNTLKRIFETLTAWPVTAVALRPWQEAMVAAGGVNLREINYNTFESLKCPGLFVTGELLDVDAQSGGFNLHFAWASGFIAAQNL